MPTIKKHSSKILLMAALIVLLSSFGLSTWLGGRPVGDGLEADANAGPACAEAVNRNGNKPILFGNLNDPDSEISRRLVEVGGTRLRADMGLNPGVRYQGL